ncbi:phosphatidate cytidylyltransferase [Paenibacillus swuensis]|uniref:Phosphatidate cytidylyltransferase n=1 Tax=Paenibacillus swuensis TaxID=1178515 RepID=A0A172TKL6_9BACL|nr:phosphatidate cytidylyltransferase [Paenibacillus swuensis]ANE47570.1 phosphatidate cytidylyltransferase [Paenibacillus swuensis]
MKQRIITGVLAGAVFLFLLVLGEYWFRALIIGLSLVGYYEFVKMNGLKVLEAPSLVGFVGILFFVFPWNRIDGLNLPSSESSVWLLMLVFFAITVISKNKKDIDKVSVLFIGVIYIGIGFHYMIVTRAIPEHGLYWTFLLFSCIWATDSGAYFTGWSFGKHLLWPEISPKKTIEGAVGGTVVSVIAAVCFSLYAPELLTIGNAIWIGITVALFGQLGDLIQSAYKRVRGVKDSGNVLPGHGGILDRCDSWLIVFPIVHILGLVQY